MMVSGLFLSIPNSCFCSLTATCEKDGCQQVWSYLHFFLAQLLQETESIFLNNAYQSSRSDSIILGWGTSSLVNPALQLYLVSLGLWVEVFPTWRTWVENEEGWFPKKDQGPVNWTWNGQDSRNNRCPVHHQSGSPFKVPDSSPLSSFSPRQDHLEWATPILLSPNQRKYKDLFSCHTLSHYMHPQFSQRTWLWMLRLRPRFTSE